MWRISNELSLIERELENLVQVIISGNASDTINFAIKDREQRKIRLKSELNTLNKKQENAPAISEQQIVEKMSQIQAAILENPMRCHPLLRSLFSKKIIMSPMELPSAANGTYTASGMISYNGVLEESFSRRLLGKKNGAANLLPLFSPDPESCVSDNRRFSMFENGVTNGD